MSSALASTEASATHNHIARLPAELLSDIFTKSMPKPANWPQFRDARKQLYSVDRHWRRVAHSTSQLWTSLPITPATSLAFVASTFERTEHLPLSICLRIAPWNEGRRTAQDVLMDVLPFLVTNFMRIRHLAIDCRLADWISIAAQLQMADTDALRRLSVTFNLPYALLTDRPFAGSFPSPFQSCNLHELNLEKAPAIWSNSGVFASLVRLRLVDLGRLMHIAWPILADALNNTKRLEVLEMVNVECTLLDTARHVTLPSVKHFTMKYQRAESIDTVSLLELPSVDALHIESVFAENVGHLVEKVGRLLGNPRSAVLLLAGCSTADYGRLISAMPQIVALDISGSHFLLAASTLKMFTDEPFKFPNLLEFKTSAALQESEVNEIMGSGPVQRVVIARHTSKEEQPYKIWSKSEGALQSRFSDFHYSDPSVVSEWSPV